MDHRKAIGRQIRMYRKKRNYSLENLSTKIYKSKSIVSKYELGQSNIDISTLYDIATALSINVACLLDIPADESITSTSARYGIFEENILYLYIMEQSRKKHFLHSGVLTFSDTGSGTISATLYMDVEDVKDYNKCKSVFRGTLLSSPYNATLMLSNPLETSEHIVIMATLNRTSKNMCSGLYNGYTLLDNLPYSTNAIISKIPLLVNDALIDSLMVTKDRLHLLKNGNVYTSNDFVNESLFIK